MHLRPESKAVGVRLRGYTQQDFEALWTLDQQCFSEGIAYSRAELQHYIGLRTAFTLVAEDEAGVVAGFLVAHKRRSAFGHILTIDVDPAKRKTGIGTLLLRGAHERLVREGCHTVFLETAVDNVAAIAFYKRHGYSVLRTLPRYYQSTGMDAFLLSAKIG